MRLSLLRELATVCPVCAGAGLDSPVVPSPTARIEDDRLTEGILHCSREECSREYPVLGGLPLLVGPLSEVVTQQALGLLARDDLGDEVENLVADCLGPEHVFGTTRQHVSSYAWDHYGEFDDGDPVPVPDGAEPGAIVRLLESGLALLPARVADGTRALDLGCGTGRVVLELAGRGATAVGIDVYLALLRTGRRVFDEGRIRFPLRRTGLVHEMRDHPVPVPDGAAADLWAADALAPPFAAGSFDLVTSLNVLDVVGEPARHLAAVARVLRPGGAAILATPYDWSERASPRASWIGGHSSRARHRGDPPTVLRGFIERGGAEGELEALSIATERDDLPWAVRLHDRSLIRYRVHLLILTKA